MLGFEMEKCVLIKKIEREATENAVCVLELYIHGHWQRPGNDSARNLRTFQWQMSFRV